MPAAPLDLFHPLVRTWFTETLGEPSAPQRAGWPAIADGSDTLILAPTGTGKTLAAFLYELNALITDGLEHRSPTRSISSTSRRSRRSTTTSSATSSCPLAQLKQRFEAHGEKFPEIRVAVRTGDTPAVRARADAAQDAAHPHHDAGVAAHPAHERARPHDVQRAARRHRRRDPRRRRHEARRAPRAHARAPRAPRPATRRSASASPPRRRPLEEIARFLGGCERQRRDTRSVPSTIVDCGLVKKMETDDPLARRRPRARRRNDLDVRRAARPRPASATRARRSSSSTTARSPRRSPRASTRSPARRSRSRITARSRASDASCSRSGSRRASCARSSPRAPSSWGSTSARSTSCSSSRVPKRVAAALQRVGRAGHSLDAMSRGVFVPTFRDDALEQMAIVGAMSEGDVEPTRVVQNALDVLAQIIVACVASDSRSGRPPSCSTSCAAPTRTTRSRARVRRDARDARRQVSERRRLRARARVSWDRITDTLTPMRAARMVATISGGTIPDRGLYTVNLADKTRLGELDEEFVHESRVGDAFQLGSSTWRIRAIEHDRVIVVPAPGAPARMPFWHGEFMARSAHLTARVGELRRELDDARTLADLATIQSRYHADEPTTRSLVEYVQSQRAITRIVPDDTRLVLEHFRDEVGSVRMVLHAPFGGRVNAPWGMALGRRVRERLGVEVQVQTTDDGIMLRLPDLGSAPPVDVFRDARRRRGGAARARGGRCVVAVRRALPHERGARAAAAARQSAPPHAALAAAAQGGRSAPGGERVPVVPDRRRDVSRRAAGRVRHGGAARRARSHRVGRDHDPRRAPPRCRRPSRRRCSSAS